MELKRKLLFTFILLVLLLLEVSETRSRHRIKRCRNRFRTRIRTTPRIRPTTKSTTTSPTPRPTSLNSTIPQEKCKSVVKELPKNRQQGPICLRLSEPQKLAMLRKVGGYIPRYMATDLKHAYKFVDLSWDQLPISANLSSLVQQNTSQSNWSDVKSILRQQEESTLSTGNKTNIRRKRTTSSSPVTIIRQCQNEGSPSVGRLLRLCAECSARTMLPTGVFPPFINEVVCGGDMCSRNIGVCQQEVIKFNFLRSTGEFERVDDDDDDDDDDVFVEKFETFEQDIRTCCQCRIFPFIFG